MSCDASLFAKTGKIFALATAAVCGRELMIKSLDADEAAEGYTKLTVREIFEGLDGPLTLWWFQLSYQRSSSCGCNWVVVYVLPFVATNANTTLRIQCTIDPKLASDFSLLLISDL
jgi:hypothetical protein